MIFSKLKYFFAASLALLCATAFSVDFGGAVRNSTNFKGTSFSNIKIDQIDDVNVWVKIPFTKSGNVYFTAEGLYEFEYDGHAETAYNRLDIDLFKLSASFQLKDNSLNINAGRFIYADLTGLVFNQNADGTFVGFNTPYFGVSIYGAYTGLLNACLVSILDNPLDPYTYDAKAPYDLAQKYAVGSATISFPAIAKTQNISAQFFGAFKVSGTSYNRMYAQRGRPDLQNLLLQRVFVVGLAKLRRRFHRHFKHEQNPIRLLRAFQKSDVQLVRALRFRIQRPL